MNHGIYTITAGALAIEKKYQIVTNNLANVNTTGFKEQKISFASMLPLDKNESEAKEGYPPEIKKGIFNTFPYATLTSTDFSEGSLKYTGNTFDFAISGKGFFMVKDNKGRIYFTRDGSFKTTKDGYLITNDGEKVLDVNQNPIKLDLTNAEYINVDEKGNIYVNDEQVGQIGVWNVNDYSSLMRYGYNKFEINPKLKNRVTPFLSNNYSLQQGYLEASNVNLIKEMVSLIEVQRHYQACQKVITTIDSQLDSRAINDVGRI